VNEKGSVPVVVATECDFDREVVRGSWEQPVVAVFHADGDVVSDGVLAALQWAETADGSVIRKPVLVKVPFSCVGGLAVRHRVKAAPTVLAFDRGGFREIPVILGVNTGPEDGWWLPGPYETLTALLWELQHRMDAFVFVRIDAGAQPAVAKSYHAGDGPCLVLLRGGVEASRLSRGGRKDVLEWFRRNGMDVDYGEHGM